MLLLTALLGLSVVTFYAAFVDRMERRTNLVELQDPTFRVLPLWDTSVPIAGLLWGTAVLFFWHYDTWDPNHAIWTFILLMLSRSLVLYLHPFLGHHTMRPLRDPLLEWVTGTTGQPYRNDESFGGHVSTLCALGLLAPAWRSWFFTAAALTAILITISRVHYAGDNIIAVPFAYWAYAMGPAVGAWWHQHVSGWGTLGVTLGWLGVAWWLRGAHPRGTH